MKKKSTVTNNFLLLMTIMDKIFGPKPVEPITSEEAAVTSLVNACLLGDPPNKSNPNFLPDFLQSYIEFNKVELTEQQCKNRDEIHFIHKDGITVAKKYLTMNLIT